MISGADSWYTNRWLQCLKLTVSITMLARGWLTYRWDSPVRGLLWNEQYLTPILQSWFDLNWQDYASQSDAAITTGLEWAGIGLMLSSIIPWLPTQRRWMLTVLLAPATLILVLDAVARWVASGMQLGAAIEKSLQWGIPIAWVLVLFIPTNQAAWRLFVKLLVGLTFIGHGFYAMGFHPVPWSYQSMTGDILNLSETGALQFLKIAGYLDFLVAFAIFIRGFEKVALVYMVLWGGATALARFISHPTSIDPWVVETLVRTCHWAIPALLLVPTPKERSCFFTQ